VSAMEPALPQNIGAAFFLPGMAQVRNPWHLRALIQGCRSLGVDLHPHQAARGLARQGGRIRAAKTDMGEIAAGQFVVAAGAWTDALLAEVGCELGVHPVRGQIVLLNPGTQLVRHILLWGARYLVPRGDGRVLVGSTEEDAGFDKRTTASGVQGLLELATALVPLLAQAPVEKCWA